MEGELVEGELVSESVPAEEAGRRASGTGHRSVAELELGCSLVRADFDAMARLEASFYGEDLITPAEEAWHWYQAFPFTTFAARDVSCEGDGARNDDDARDDAELGAIVGFVNLFPVRREVFEATLAGAFNDADLLASDVENPFGPSDAGPDAPLNMLLSCAVVEPAWQKTGLAYRLLAGAAAQFASAIRPIASVVIDTATDDGARFARRLGFAPVRPTDHGTYVWVHTWEGMLAAL